MGTHICKVNRNDIIGCMFSINTSLFCAASVLIHQTRKQKTTMEILWCTKYVFFDPCFLRAGGRMLKPPSFSGESNNLATWQGCWIVLCSAKIRPSAKNSVCNSIGLSITCRMSNLIPSPPDWSDLPMLPPREGSVPNFPCIQYMNYMRLLNITRIANAVPLHSLVKGHNEC